MMKTVTYNYTVVQVPDDEADYSLGILVGPPELDRLNLPDDVTQRLRMELFARGLIRKQDVAKQRQEVMNALIAAFTVSVDRIMECYTQ